MTGAEHPFRFAQFEFPGVLGPASGRYVVRDQRGVTPRHVLVVAVLGAPQRRLLRRRRPRAAPPEPQAAAVATTRATVIEAEPLPGEAAAEVWLEQARADADDHIDQALKVLNGALRAHGAAAADPLAREVRREQALIARLGWGWGEQVAQGRWVKAIAVPTPERRRRRADTLRPQERLAAVLGGRDRLLAAEALALRARLDLDSGRDREAALQLRIALEAALAELAADGGQPASMADRLAELRERRDATAAAANEALSGPLTPARAEDVKHTLERLEAALRARALSALDQADGQPLLRAGAAPPPARRRRRRRA